MHLNHHHIIAYREPLSTVPRRQRRFGRVTYNDRSPEVSAMNAHLRVSAYPERVSTAQGTDLNARAGAAPIRRRSFLNLLREYDKQARDNFSKEAVPFLILTVMALAWPIFYTFRTLVR
jgi:hypothetical protein